MDFEDLLLTIEVDTLVNSIQTPAHYDYIDNLYDLLENIEDSFEKDTVNTIVDYCGETRYEECATQPSSQVSAEYVVPGHNSSFAPILPDVVHKTVTRGTTCNEQVDQDKNQCSKCSKNFPSVHRLVKHLQNVHMKKVKRSKQSVKISQVEKKSEDKHPSTATTIPLCRQQILNARVYNFKKMVLPTVAFVNGSKIWKCQFCQKVFSNKANLVQHLKCKHSDLTTTNCYFCQRVFNYPSSLVRHLRNKHAK